MPHGHGMFTARMSITHIIEITSAPAFERGAADLVARLGVGGCPPPRRGESTRSPHFPAEVLIDASSVSASLADGIIHVKPAPNVTALALHIEECSDGSILISDELGFAGYGNIPHFRQPFTAIHITLGVNCDDTITFDFPAHSRRRGWIRIFTAFGDDITDNGANRFTCTRLHPAVKAPGLRVLPRDGESRFRIV